MRLRPLARLRRRRCAGNIAAGRGTTDVSRREGRCGCGQDKGGQRGQRYALEFVHGVSQDAPQSGRELAFHPRLVQGAEPISRMTRLQRLAIDSKTERLSLAPDMSA